MGLAGCGAFGGESTPTVPSRTATEPVEFPNGLRVDVANVVRKRSIRYADGGTVRTHEFDRPVWNVAVRLTNTRERAIEPPPADRFRLQAGGERVTPRRELPGRPTWTTERQPTNADELLPPTEPYPTVLSPGGTRVVVLLFAAPTGEPELLLFRGASEGATLTAWQLSS